jgi:hypothetical protein
LSACHENLGGFSQRAKLRLRWYDAPFPREEVFVEVKRRVGRATTKERHRLDLAGVFESAPTRDTVKAIAASVPRSLREILLARPDAVVIVEYERSYFEAKGGSARITLDRDLVFYSQVGRLRPIRLFPVRAPEILIVEVKTPGDGEEALRELLHPLAPRVTRSSKYVLGCQAIGLLPGSYYA